MKIKNIKLIALPAVVVLGGLGYASTEWFMELMNKSLRTNGTIFNKYAVELPKQTPTLPSQSYLCPVGQKDPWSGCGLKKPE